jgi:hypothetical protein
MTKRTFSDAEAGKKYRFAQIQKMLDIFEQAHGRPAETIEEFEKWSGSPEGHAALAYDHDASGKIIPD